jgi:DnaD/phage-associated family protein
MGKTTKVYINYEGSQEERARSVLNADESDLRVLSALLLFADSEGCASLAQLESLLEMDASDIGASVKFWRGAGIVSATKPKNAVHIAPATEENTSESAHKNGAVARIVGVESYTNDELSSVLEQRVSGAFVDEAQKAMGRIFNKNEVGKLVGFVDQLGFEEEAVLAILSYCVRLDKKSLSYAEKIALSFHDEDIFTAADVHAQIDYLERRNSTLGKIQELFGFGGRRLSTNEKKYFVAWTEEWGFGIEVINKAYEITVDTIHEPAPKYTNSILKKWHDNGLVSLAEVESFIVTDEQTRQASVTRTSKPKKQTQKNTDVEDWFEQRLRQSFGE